jgi:predicted SAM-dependent methyltransferase
MLIVPPLNEMLLQFESLGDNCEFGLVQGHFDADDALSLLRFAGFEIPAEQRLERLIGAIGTGFADLGRPEAINVSVEGPSGHEEFLVRETTYQLMYHTFQSPNYTTAEKIRVREGDRLNFLRRKFLEDLAAGTKLYVWKCNMTMPEDSAVQLLAALRRRGANSLFWVSQADTGELSPTVTRACDGLLRGYIRRLAPYHNATDIAYADWAQLCPAAYKLWKQGHAGQAQAATNTAPLAQSASRVSGAVPHDALRHSPGRKTPQVACIMMQKDERFLLKPWLAYHAYLFGFENVFVFDNGSELAEVRNTLAEYESKGVTIYRNHASREDYRAKATIIGDQIKRLDACRQYDFLIPLDCDEFIVLENDSKYTTSRDAILAYLASLIGETRLLRFPYQLANHPLHPDIYHYFTFFKIFFAADTFTWMDHGHHEGQSRKAEGFRDTQLVHLHFHYQPLDRQVEKARLSWVGSISTDDRSKLADYHGPSGHLVPYFLKTKQQYYEGLLDNVYFYLPQLRELLKSLGASLDMPAEPVPEDLTVKVVGPDPASLFDGRGQTILIPTRTLADTVFNLAEFNAALYAEANPELAGSGMSPLAHYCLYGFRERRPLHPPVVPRGHPATHNADTLTGSAGPDHSPDGTSPHGSSTRQRIAAYVAGQGPIRPGPDGFRCIELGSGAHLLPGWLHTDLDATAHVLPLDATQAFPIDDRVFDYVYTEHMIEHIAFEQGCAMIRECFRIMKAGAIIRIVTPSIGFLMRLFSHDRSELEEHYIEWATRQFTPNAPAPLPSFVFNNFVRQWGHQFIYDRTTLRWVLSETGFVDITECRISQSDHAKLRNLETVTRMPDGFLELESMIFEAMRPRTG